MSGGNEYAQQVSVLQQSTAAAAAAAMASGRCCSRKTCHRLFNTSMQQYNKQSKIFLFSSLLTLKY